ncbi:MAG TPA: hypothetical protein VHY19_02755 [Steroidobacteraceae bacterium]|nr:hypothetical protein [Steroidobacteraceae bacterium]
MKAELWRTKITPLPYTVAATCFPYRGSVSGRQVFIEGLNFRVRSENQDALIACMRDDVSLEMPGLISAKLRVQKLIDGKAPDEYEIIDLK